MAVRKRNTCSAAWGASSARTPLAVEAGGAGALPEAGGSGLSEGTDEEDDEPGGVLPLAGPAGGGGGAGAEGAGVSFEVFGAGSAAWTTPPAPRSAVNTAVRR
jgi:hypothetical protein